jgi:hypothetical protein
MQIVNLINRLSVILVIGVALANTACETDHKRLRSNGVAPMQQSENAVINHSTIKHRSAETHREESHVSEGSSSTSVLRFISFDLTTRRVQLVNPGGLSVKLVRSISSAEARGSIGDSDLANHGGNPMNLTPQTKEAWDIKLVLSDESLCQTTGRILEDGIEVTCDKK